MSRISRQLPECHISVADARLPLRGLESLYRRAGDARAGAVGRGCIFIVNAT